MASPIRSLTITTVLAALSACGSNTAPELAPIADQIAQVGVELTLEVLATDADGDELSFRFEADNPDIDERANMTVSVRGTGVFRWTPLADDVGIHSFDFIADDGDIAETLTIQIEVRSSLGLASTPIFREPAGSGTPLELSREECISIPILVEDQDSTTVTFAIEEPAIAGGELSQLGGLQARWDWCPSRTQLASGPERHLLTVSADDGANPKTLKHYLIVLRKPLGTNCPGGAPSITHTTADHNTLLNLQIPSAIADDIGLKNEPLLYYSYQDVGNDPDLSAMNQVTMRLDDGDLKSGSWVADIPNPVAGGDAGDGAELYYVIVANDNDDETGDCDHLTREPATGAHRVRITHPGGFGGAEVCASCTTDAQCGGADDLCVRVGASQDGFCLRTCGGPGECPDNYSCSQQAVTSIDGAAARQCVPLSSDCANPAGELCVDDSFEENDTRAQADANPQLLLLDDYELTSCPSDVFGGDEDWFALEVLGQGDVIVTINGQGFGDLDVALVDGNGHTLVSSTANSSYETVSHCVLDGPVYAHVVSYGFERTDYTLSFTGASRECAGNCLDDSREPDGSPLEARNTAIQLSSYFTFDNQICAYDDDWYAVDLVDGDTVIVQAFFTHADGDLDLHFYDADGTDLTPCSEDDPSTCSAFQGQSVTDDEYWEFTLSDVTCTPAEPCTFYPVVHGWQGAQNTYDIAMELLF